MYDIVEYGNMKEKIANKLIIEESEDKDDDKIDCHSLMKYPWNSYNNSIYSNTTNILSNYPSSLKNKLKSRSTQHKDNNINYCDLKLLSQKGFEAMKTRYNKGYSRKINNVMKQIDLNRKKFNSLSETNFKIFNKNKNEILDNDIF